MSVARDLQDDKDVDKDAEAITPDDSAESNEIRSTENQNAANDQERQNQPQQNAGPPPPPNGGYGWVCTACCALINAHTWGLNSSYGVFLAHYLQTNTYPGSTSLDFAFIGGLSISCAMLIAPVATLSTRYCGTKVTLFTGVFLEALSLITASFAKKIWHLFLSQGVAFGLGMGFLFVGSVGIPPQWVSSCPRETDVFDSQS